MPFQHIQSPSDRIELYRVADELRLRPSIVTWSRLEPLALTRGDLAPGLQALLGDPLWLMGRQWQFEELRAEDAGSPVLVTLSGERAPLSRFRAGRAGGVAGDLPELPVEVAVEAELPPVLPERIRAEGGQHLLRMLGTVAAPAATRAALRDAVVAAYAFGPPAAELVEADPAGAGRRRLLAGRVPDAGLVEADVAPLLDGEGGLRGLPDALGPAAGDADVMDVVGAVLVGWLGWYRGYLAAPTGASWDPHRLEYAFAVQATLGDGPVVLDAGEYADGTVDWFTFDAAAGPDLGAPTAAVPVDRVDETVLATPVRYPGMPADRLFQFEDARVYLGGIEAGPTDVARLALVEYALVFGNDWYLAPVDLPYGSVARIDSVVVRDTFGGELAVAPARQASRPGWTVFHLPPYDEGGRLADVFVLPPTVRTPLESPPLEEVALFRDEMANLVWGVERVVTGPTGEPLPPHLAAPAGSLRQQIPGDLDDARIVYRLMTPVPDNWIPFVAVPAADRPAGALTTELERRPMIRFADDGTARLVHPRGVLLRSSPDADPATDRLRVAEEEVPRDGVVVTRTYQLARTAGGGTVLWIGRTKQVGRGEGASGLRFDTALPPAGL